MEETDSMGVVSSDVLSVGDILVSPLYCGSSSVVHELGVDSVICCVEFHDKYDESKFAEKITF